MVYIYEILKNYYEGQPKLLHNWMFQEERMGMDKGKQFTLMGWDEQDRKEKPLMDLRRVGIINNMSIDELITELQKGREHGTKFLESHGIEVPKSS